MAIWRRRAAGGTARVSPSYRHYSVSRGESPWTKRKSFLAAPCKKRYCVQRTVPFFLLWDRDRRQLYRAVAPNRDAALLPNGLVRDFHLMRVPVLLPLSTPDALAEEVIVVDDGRHLLGCQNLPTGGAVRPLGEAGALTGRLHSRICHHGVNMRCRGCGRRWGRSRFRGRRWGGRRFRGRRRSCGRRRCG